VLLEPFTGTNRFSRVENDGQARRIRDPERADREENVSADVTEASSDLATGPSQIGAEPQQLENPVNVKAAARFLGVSLL